jgi:hypothetical protein
MERRTGFAIFAVLFLAYAWFHQGGGWNQNVRFAQVRAIAGGSFAIDDQLFYSLEVGGEGASRYRRVELTREEVTSARLPRAVSLDLSEHAGHLYPNKPPGLSLLAVPAYLGTRALEGAFGLDPDDWWTLTLGLYLTSLFSVGLISALGGVAFYDVARRLFPTASPRAHIAATLAYGLGTPVFAYASFLIDHAVVASLSLLTLRSLLVAREAPPRRHIIALFSAGSLAGLAVLVNNSAALAALWFGIYALAVHPARAEVLAYVAGGVAPALALAAYQWICFGHPLDLPQDHQLAMFQTSAPLLGVFSAPRWDLLPKLLVMPYRGLLFWSPVLAPGLLALGALLAGPRRRPEALLFAALFLSFWLMNASFNAWHGGGTFGPRYLVPAVPFLALPLVAAFERARRTTAVFALASVGLALLVTAVSPQLDAGVHRPLGEFYLPLARGESVESAGFLLRGPVSVHPVGFVAGGLESLDGHSQIARWSSFNLGELFFPGSWASIAPLALVVGLVALRLLRTETGRSPP